ncbi:MAG: ATP-dependent zinc metalloprotease FtsH [Bacteroidales bacterium]|jgi:cell division protease FtsH|nr:ATP-dependent zinc metalloprotease FtsH [Bacteroidales bacterium]MCH3941465.1 ATP-dependent zinc metalloprotease FtsH [Bacteroidales bacterium]MCI2136117.1 ATP-dependent zinc metalloprotease FtsH [Bacteroidales bacterium]MDY6378907.1 ATP-dependent zinc metalloprotease FtsH [Bacteroidales bacterium]MDY6384375.1 ATP-dependent zinc metalloprotease FtsH [Bacteroidales bacterium]
MAPKIRRIRINLSWLYILLLIGIGWLLFSQSGANPQKIEWAEVKEMFLGGDIKEIKFIRNDYKGNITIKPDRLSKYSEKFGGKLPTSSPHFFFLVSDKFDAESEFGALNAQMPASDQVKITIENQSKVWGSVLEWIIFPIILIVMWLWMLNSMNRNMGGGSMGSGQGGIFNVGKSTGKLADKNKVNVTFKDVAGLYGAKEEVMEIVDFLKNPAKYTALGGKIPKGALLVGPPGTGKTLLAKAVAGEANVPFFSISGSDFVEMFVGVGASRVRDLFRQAKEKAPCIVFIDEIDAVGRARAKNAGFSSNDERENTLNQLLTEMDGFDTNSGVIILAATNRADILDKALLRAGRFDRQIHVDLPELKERVEIFKVHMKGLKIDPNFDVEFIAKNTPGFSGADIANVCNEAALTAARKNKPMVDKADFLDAVDRIVGGLERKSATIMTPEEKRTTAYHEAGHAVVGWLLPYGDNVFKVSIIPRGQALGLTWYLPDEKKMYPKSYMIQQMCCLIGGRVAEEIVNGEPATGALNDLERMTNMAYGMVQYYGMSEKIGNVSFYDSTGSRGYELSKPYSEKTAEVMDQEVKDLVNYVHEQTEKLLLDHKEGFVQVAELLLEKEVIFAEDIENILGPKVKHEEKTAEAEEMTN